jgi:hypothetical protein
MQFSDMINGRIKIALKKVERFCRHVVPVVSDGAGGADNG